jgi:prepilin-type N-terminal cleavage/methylation domain-containing protein
MNLRARHTRPRAKQRGHTLIEVIVASTIFVIFIAGLYGATGILFSLLDLQRDRTETLLAMNVARARLVADARGVSSATCVGAATLELSTTGGGPPQTVEYSSDGSHLVRWASVDNKNYYVADGLGSISCQTLSDGAGVEVAMTFGEAPDQFALYMTLLEL